MARLVYFIEAIGIDALKVGSSEDVLARLADLQTSIPFDLKLLGAVEGGTPYEKRLHREFRVHRIRGEWFRLSGVQPDLPEILKGAVPVRTTSALWKKFLSWCKKQRNRSDEIGEIANDILQDLDWHHVEASKVSDIYGLLFRIRCRGGCREAQQAAKLAWTEFSGLPFVELCGYCDKAVCECPKDEEGV